jgi:hypothetical protein
MMNNPKLIYIITLFLFSTSLMAQVKVNPDIQKKVDAFISLSNEKKWNEAFDLMYPKLFSKVPKQDLIDMMTGMDQDGLTLQRNNVKLDSVFKPLKDENETFVRLEYTGDLIVAVTKGSLYDTPSSIQSMSTQFETSYGESNVKWDSDNKKYSIQTHISMMAIKSGDQWYLVEINNDQKELMQFLFSENVMKTLVGL